MYPPLGPNLRARVLARMHAHPAADATVELPEWYFRHWHFGPGGYLTGVGIRWYDWVVRRAYYQLHEGGAHAAVLNALGEAGCRKVVEVGCGSGRLLRSLVASRQFDAVTGLEISPLLVDRARRQRAAERRHPRRGRRGGGGRGRHGARRRPCPARRGGDAARSGAPSCWRPRTCRLGRTRLAPPGPWPRPHPSGRALSRRHAAADCPQQLSAKPRLSRSRQRLSRPCVKLRRFVRSTAGQLG